MPTNNSDNEKFAKALAAQNLKEANSILMNGSVKPLNIDYSKTELDELSMTMSIKGFDAEKIVEYQNLVDKERDNYCAPIQEEIKKLKVVGVEMLLNLLSDNNKSELSIALSNYQKNSSNPSELNAAIESAKGKVNYTDNDNKKKGYYHTKELLEKADSLQNHLSNFQEQHSGSRASAMPLKDFIDRADKMLTTSDGSLKNGGFFSQKVQACFEAIRKAIYNVTNCYSVLNNEQKEKVTLKSMKEEMTKMRADFLEETAQPTISSR